MFIKHLLCGRQGVAFTLFNSKFFSDKNFFPFVYYLQSEMLLNLKKNFKNKRVLFKMAVKYNGCVCRGGGGVGGCVCGVGCDCGCVCVCLSSMLCTFKF